MGLLIVNGGSNLLARSVVCLSKLEAEMSAIFEFVASVFCKRRECPGTGLLAQHIGTAHS